MDDRETTVNAQEQRTIAAILLFAAKIVQGQSYGLSMKELAEMSVEAADHLIEALERPRKDPYT